MRPLIEKSKPGSMYISGRPGTGKTACVTHILSNCRNVSVLSLKRMISLVNLELKFSNNFLSFSFLENSNPFSSIVCYCIPLPLYFNKLLSSWTLSGVQLPKKPYLF
jgi:hypothetical protein